MLKQTVHSLIAIAFLLLVGNAWAQEAPGAHLAIKNPAILQTAEINAVYDALKERMASGYALSKLPEIKNYQSWKRYNSESYISATHGQRYVNNYANRLAKKYGKIGKGEAYPAGAVFAKDTITVTSTKKTYPGAIFIMEKLKPGANPDTADWRYIMVLPDGSLFGDTMGDEPEAVEYCFACHIQKSKQDYVFYVPKKFRVTK